MTLTTEQSDELLKAANSLIAALCRNAWPVKVLEFPESVVHELSAKHVGGVNYVVRYCDYEQELDALRRAVPL